MIRTTEEARAWRAKLNGVTATLDDAAALDNIDLYLKWQTDTSYAVGDRRRDGDGLYRCIQSHTSQEGWNPSATPALWVRISLDEWPEWVQPAGAHDAYEVGAKVSHASKHWTSDVDNNTWEPGVYGWSEVED